MRTVTPLPHELENVGGSSSLHVSERGGLVFEIGHHDVEIPDIRKRLAGGPQCIPQTVSPGPIDQWPAGAQKLTEPPDRHAVVVQLLRIGSQPGAGIVIQDIPEIPA
jgi:hypothetical protein